MIDSVSNKIPDANSRAKTSGISPVWVIPIIAAIVGGWLVFKAAVNEEVFIEVTFNSAAGLEAGKTPVKLRNVKVGELTEVRFTNDLSEVVVVMEITGVSKERLTDSTKFWVVKPRIGVEGVSGLDTLLSGAYIEMDPGEGGLQTSQFKGLEEPQLYQLGNPGTTYKLQSTELGSLVRGSAVKYRGITVGSVTKYHLVEDHSYVELEIFIESPHDQYINNETRFWNASGVSLELNEKGFDFDMESISSLVSGGIEFSSSFTSDITKQAVENTSFILHKTKLKEVTESVTFGAPMKLYFDKGVQGLSIGAAVEYKGMRVGTVSKVGVDLSEDKENILTYALIDIEPERLPLYKNKVAIDPEVRIKNVYDFFERMIAQGLHAQLKSNFLTGQSLIVLDVFERESKTQIVYEGKLLVVPTVPETVAGLLKQINDLMDRFNALPIENIGHNLDDATKNMNDLIKSLNAEEGGMTGVQLNQTMDELSKAAHSIRIMSEYLERHPEALIKGKKAE